MPPACGLGSDCLEDAACGAGTCQSLTGLGGPCTCVGPRPEAQRNFCDGGPECCQDADCPQPGAPGIESVCQAEGHNPLNGYCGGARPPEWNACRTDACSADVPCDQGLICVPAGAYGHITSICTSAVCRTDADCGQRPGGICRPFFSTCDSYGFVCTYADDECGADRPCPPGEQAPNKCVPTDDRHGLHCVPNFPRP